MLDTVDAYFNSSDARHLVDSLWLQAFVFLILVSFRFYIMGTNPPEFSSSDNPIAHDKSWLTRTLTFLYLPLMNLGLILFPESLSFDWSMDAVSPVHSPLEFRSLLSFGFYFLLFSLIRKIFPRGLRSQISQMRLSNLMEVNNNTTVVGNKNKPPPCFKATMSPMLSKSSAAASAVHVSSWSSSDDSHRCRICLGLCLLVFPFLPASNLFFYVGFVIAERVLYLPSMGAAILVAEGCDILYERHRRKGKLFLLPFWCILGVVLCSWTCRTVIRNQDWSSEEKLYASGIAVNPPKAYGNLGIIFAKRGQFAKAEMAYRRALDHRPNMADTHYNLFQRLQPESRCLFEWRYEERKSVSADNDVPAVASRPLLS
ncbi:unnamed protein product [Cyprideis torosa]|uniref:dolichyl-phosphate-mannose--protein mannosyltransferase n=1 Tax=Cyprideis torosa TaxID=163714 RepID=A0A7R8ZI27_9CRUS|nr:unnamed protein product [Cyprideis torosa]CAG0879154.1 unnamed protein product [Cyprideis torosa]